MSQAVRLSEDLVKQILEQYGDHAAALAELAARVEPAAGELFAAWLAANRSTLVDARVAPETVPTDQQVQAMQSWFAALREREVERFFLEVSAWPRQLASLGIAYDRTLALFREYQRVTIPLLIQVFPAGPELQAALDAFDDLFDGCRTLIGAEYVDRLQQQIVGESRAFALGHVFGGVTHALNNILTVVLGRVTLLRDRTRDADIREELLAIEESAAAGAQMLRRLQSYMQDDRSETPVRTQVNQLLRDAAEVTRFLWRDLAETHGIVIDVVRDFADVPDVNARPAALREAFVVLIVNAVEARAGGGVITLRTERQRDFVLVSVISAGPVSGAVKPDRRSPLSAGSQLTGASARLSSAEKTAAELGGRLMVDTTAEQGTVYTIALPVADEVAEEGREIAMTSQPAEILFVDNEPGVRDAFSRLLSLYGHHVVTAEGGESGIAAFQGARFDLVFTDLGMPGMSGWDVAREIKKISPSALVVLVTGWPIDLDERKSKETGVDRVMTKPLDMTLVLSLIEDAVALRHGA